MEEHNYLNWFNQLVLRLQWDSNLNEILIWHAQIDILHFFIIILHLIATLFLCIHHCSHFLHKLSLNYYLLSTTFIQFWEKKAEERMFLFLLLVKVTWTPQKCASLITAKKYKVIQHGSTWSAVNPNVLPSGNTWAEEAEELKSLSDTLMKDNKQSGPRTIPAKCVLHAVADRCVIIYWLSSDSPLHLSGFWQAPRSSVFVISAGPWPWDHGERRDLSPYQVSWPNKLLVLSRSPVDTTGVKSCSVDLYQILPVSQATQFAERSGSLKYNKDSLAALWGRRCFWICVQ